MRSPGILSDLVLSIRKFVVDFSTYRALRWLQAGHWSKLGAVCHGELGKNQLLQWHATHCFSSPGRALPQEAP